MSPADNQNSPFPLSETVSRLIAHSFTRQLIPPLKPLLRQTDRPDDRNLGAPQEFINQDNFLEAIGEVSARQMVAIRADFDADAQGRRGQLESRRVDAIPGRAARSANQVARIQEGSFGILARLTSQQKLD